MPDPRKWTHIAFGLRTQLATRELKPGDRINMSQLAVARHSTPGTVRRALEELAREGRVEFVPCRGYYVTRPPA